MPIEEHTSETPIPENHRVAELARYNDETIGVCLYLTAGDLRHLGIDPGRVSQVGYRIDHASERVIIDPVPTSDEQGVSG
jgi:hypothetical protein